MERNARDNLQDLLFATLQLRYLQGLTLLPIGIWMICFPLLGRAAQQAPYLAFTGLIALSAGMIFAAWRIVRYYRVRYGYVEFQSNKWHLFGLGAWGAIFFWLLIQAPHGTPAVALWLAAFFWGIYMGSSGRRWFYLLLTIAFAACSPHWADFGGWQTPILGIAFVLAGIMDHLLLHRLLPPAHPEETAPSAV